MVRLPSVTDVVGALQAQTEALAQLPGTLLALNRTARDLTVIAADARATFATLNRLATRAEVLLDEVEEPLVSLLPGLRRAAAVLEDPVIGQIPATVRQVTDDVLPVVRGLREAQERIAALTGATERLAAFPGAGAFLRRRPARPDDPGAVGPPGPPGGPPPQ